MRASEAKLLDFIRKAPQFVIPIYQRTYSWTEPECRQLWADILEAGHNQDSPPHFVGSIVYIEEGLSQVSSQSPLQVIDGQQRLTTVLLLLEALARALGDNQEPVDGFSARKIRNYYLLNPLEDGERGYKLLLTQTDKEALLSLLRQQEPTEDSWRIKENFDFFQRQIAGLEGNLESLCRGLAKLVVVDIALNRGQDNPQLIFESMNSTGLELSQADLIRNYVLMGLEPDHQTRLYRDHWRPMERDFGQQAYRQHFDRFMRHYLTVKTDRIPKIYKVYEEFKKYSRTYEQGMDALVKDVQTFAKYYCAMALNQEANSALAQAFANLRELKIDVAYPFLLQLYHDHATNHLSTEDFVQALQWVEGYIFRRAACSIPTNALNKTFAAIAKELDKTRYLESLQAHFLQLPSYRRFPDDAEFGRELKQRDLYGFAYRSYWLRRLENHRRKERVPTDEYTIEHIMPQNENLSEEWQTDLGENWQEVQKKYLHTLGNLTLTGYNSELGDMSFRDKRDHEGGFRHSPLLLNRGLGKLDTWNEARIRERADRLAQKAIEVWPAPDLPEDVLDTYRPEKVVKATTYTIEDHKYLAENEELRQLFETFRNQVLALDPCVTERFLKNLVAYRAETSFVTVVAQASRLQIFLNLEPYKLNDPRQKVQDMTDKGAFGTGDAMVPLNSREDIPYVMGLVHQAFGAQIDREADSEGDDEDEAAGE